MPLETWDKLMEEGSILSYEELLSEIKTNLISVINDYRGLGVENEDQLIQQVQTVFSGPLVPNQRDYLVLTQTLSHLATIKEAGTIYQNFLEGIHDTLGVSDLEEIRRFIDYIQSLPPEPATVSIAMEQPQSYWLSNPTDSTTDNWDHATVSWTLQNANPPKPKAVFRIAPSIREDIAQYKLVIEAGSYYKEQVFTPSQNLQTSIDLDWLAWFPANQLGSTYIKASLYTTDKRQNETMRHETTKYNTNVKIPQGVARYELQYKRDNGNWQAIASTTATSYKWDVPRINGNYQYRVRAIDKNGQSFGGRNGTTPTEWATGPARYIRFIPEKPAAPNAWADSTWNTITVAWSQAARAEYYEVWHDGSHGKNADKGLQWAKNNTSGGKTYYKRVNSNQQLRVVFQTFGADTKNPMYVRAVNEGGSAQTMLNVQTKKRVLKTHTYTSNGYKVWETSHTIYNYNWYGTFYDNRWVKTDSLFQGEWRDAYWGSSPSGWSCGRGAGYCAHGGQLHGNHMSFVFFDLNAIRNGLSNKSIQSVEFIFTRSNQKTHGYYEATPLYCYGHKRANNNTVSLADSFNLYHHNNVKVTYRNQAPIVSARFNHGETERFSNAKTKALLEGMVKGTFNGLGIAKYYGDFLGSDAPIADRAYMKLNPKVQIKVSYYDN